MAGMFDPNAPYKLYDDHKLIGTYETRAEGTRPVKATGEDGRGCAGHSIKQLWRRDFVGANSKGVAR
jgi:hypothetical protein